MLSGQDSETSFEYFRTDTGDAVRVTRLAPRGDMDDSARAGPTTNQIPQPPQQPQHPRPPSPQPGEPPHARKTDQHTTKPPASPRAIESPTWSTFAFIFLLRLVIALSTRTMYQPDEFWQSLEVAHYAVFGQGHLTWEWSNRVRGFAHPLLFSGVYRIIKYLNLDNSDAIIIGPKILQALIAASNDHFASLLAGRFFGRTAAKWTLFCTLTSWYTGYTMTRTFANSAEAALTTIALWRFPWRQLCRDADPTRPTYARRRFQDALVVAAAACIIRPTSAVIWLFVGADFAWRTRKHILRTAWTTTTILIVALAFSALIDRSFYKAWVFPPLEFYRVNVIQRVSVFYGTHPIYWYFLQSVPVIMGTFVVPFILGARDTLAAYSHSRVLLHAAVWTVGVLSLLEHKEDRFLLPVLPIMLAFTGATIARADTRSFAASLDNPTPGSLLARARLTFLVGVGILAVTNIPLAFYANVVHQRGVVDAALYVRNEAVSGAPMEVLWLMPCHSTPYYSHVHANVSMRFVSCEPPLGIENATSYKDESKFFAENPKKYLLSRYSTQIGNKSVDAGALAEKYNITLSSVAMQPETWPSHVVFFGFIEKIMRDLFEGSNYREVRRFFNSHFQLDDKMRTGDVIIYQRF
ncbi:glycosyltransferase family 22 protein [Gonapodya prolifera JEL478]|uniref:Mannosyltransferase n=1 Tax=Gonapodya prolifera (strain JEL478) TaxID=1344416 RepID=A0A139AMG1_GONPJ|nr:glycosyltransferase family 22 protein [Gonapodya prolifera JEL478]|eukprot:KXS17952.1 glycosyltransferase family 22 protein [Gonapodya prolifera JEL478]